jgi:ribosomal protein S13
VFNQQENLVKYIMRIIKIKSTVSQINIYGGFNSKIRNKISNRFQVFLNRENMKVNIDQKVIVNLTSRMNKVALNIYGFSTVINSRICSMFGVHGSYLVRFFRYRQIKFVKQYSIGVLGLTVFGKFLNEILLNCFKRHQLAGSYIYIRLMQGLPFKGQRSHTNAQTMKYFRLKIKKLLQIKDKKKKIVIKKKPTKVSKKKNKKK